MVLLSSFQEGWVSFRGTLSKRPSGAGLGGGGCRRLCAFRGVPAACRTLTGMQQLPDGRGPDPSSLCPANPRQHTTHITLPLQFPPSPLLLSEIGHLSAMQVTLSTAEAAEENSWPLTWLVF